MKKIIDLLFSSQYGTATDAGKRTATFACLIMQHLGCSARKPLCITLKDLERAERQCKGKAFVSRPAVRDGQFCLEYAMMPAAKARPWQDANDEECARFLKKKRS